MTFILFGTSGCHLCDEAEKIIVANIRQITFETVDIVEQPQWYDKYAIKIPVLYHDDTGKELFWPFSESDIDEFIRTI